MTIVHYLCSHTHTHTHTHTVTLCWVYCIQPHSYLSFCTHTHSLTYAHNVGQLIPYFLTHTDMQTHTHTHTHTPSTPPPLIYIQCLLANSLHRINSLLSAHSVVLFVCVCVCVCVKGMHRGLMKRPCLYEHGQFIMAWLTYKILSPFLRLSLSLSLSPCALVLWW